MTAVHVALGVALIAVNLAAGLWGGYGWWRHVHVPGFWPLLRIGQGLVMLQAVDGAVLLLLGHDLPELHLIYGLVPIGVAFLAEQLRLAAADTVLAQQGLVMLQAIDGAILLLMGRDLPALHLIYGLVPIGVSFLAEQLRLAAADTVLAQRGLEGRADVEALPDHEQRDLVNAILRREMGVMAASALVVTALALRAL